MERAVRLHFFKQSAVGKGLCLNSSEEVRSDCTFHIPQSLWDLDAFYILKRWVNLVDTHYTVYLFWLQMTPFVLSDIILWFDFVFQKFNLAFFVFFTTKLLSSQVFSTQRITTYFNGGDAFEDLHQKAKAHFRPPKVWLLRQF